MYLLLLREAHAYTKRLLIIPLRRSLGLPHNAHHLSIFIETRVLPIPYIQIYHSILVARRWINQATSQQEQEERFKQIYQPSPYFDLLSLHPANPLCQIALRCRSITSPHSASLSALQKAKSSQLWDAVFNHFYHTWHHSQHPSTRQSHLETHSLFSCYASMSSLPNTSLPSYLSLLSPSDASVLSRLRFNRSRLNQSLHKRRCAVTDKCPTCPDQIETVEHVVMSCPRYDVLRFVCFCKLSAINKLPPLSSSFPFPFLLCCFPLNVVNAHCNQFVRIISSFLTSVRRLRDM